MSNVSGERLRAAREALPPKVGKRTASKHMSREDLAGIIGVVSSTMQKWETGGLPFAEEYAELVRVTGVSLDYLVGAIDYPRPPQKGRKR